jgi:hypothetical protein
MSDRCLIGTDGFLLHGHIEEWELHQPFHLTLAMIGSIRRHMPEEQPLIRAEVKQGKVSGTKGGLGQARMTDLLEMATILSTGYFLGLFNCQGQQSARGRDKVVVEDVSFHLHHL